MIGSGKIAALLCCAIAAVYATGGSLAASDTASANENVRGAADRFAEQRSDQLAIRMLAAHNTERERLGLPALKWNRDLEREAEDWADVLSRRGQLQHASRDTRNGTGENLWMGTAGHWDVETMVGMFIAERRHYRHGEFPDISRTGNWADVGHYPQIVWRETKEVGCSVVTARGNDVLVCRYWPAGNVWGRRAY